MSANNDQSYQQIYSDNLLQLQQQQDDFGYQHELLLDENDQIELYQNQSPYEQQQESHTQREHNDNNIEIEQGSIIDGLNQVDKSYQNQQNLLQKEVIDFLKTNYAHFDQEILIKMLYDSLFPSAIKISINPIKQSRQTLTNIKRENFYVQTNQQRKNSLINLHQTAKVFVEHGYGINIARKFALKGQIIEPNPYNTSIGKLIKNAWKDIETQMMNMKRSIKHLRTEKFNQIKTPLIHSRNWMQKKYFDIFKQIILYTHGVSIAKPSQKSYQQIYNYVLQNAARKSKQSEKGFYKKKNKDSDIDFDESNSQQFKPQKLKKLTDERFEQLTNLVKKSFKKSGK